MALRSKDRSKDPSPPPPQPESATMIVPRGTEISVDRHGQLSISTPGNLVLQNSGSFGTLESVHGSIRIDQEVEVEAAVVRCADACFIQGSLTAWKVEARTLHLEDDAQAHIVLQETESLDVGRGARLVGNFASEDELFLLFARFAREMRSLPFLRGRSGGAPRGGERRPRGEEAAGSGRGRRVLEHLAQAVGEGSPEGDPATPASGPSGPRSSSSDSSLDETLVDGRVSPAFARRFRGPAGPQPSGADPSDTEPSDTEPSGAEQPGARRGDVPGGEPTVPLPPLLAEAEHLIRDELLEDRIEEHLEGSDRRLLGELLALMERRDLETLHHTHRLLFNRLKVADDRLDGARRRIEEHYYAP